MCSPDSWRAVRPSIVSMTVPFSASITAMLFVDTQAAKRREPLAFNSRADGCRPTCIFRSSFSFPPSAAKTETVVPPHAETNTLPLGATTTA